MQKEFIFSHLLGGIYRKGNLLFTQNGSQLLSPVGNRILIYNLKRNIVETLPFETRKNIISVALSPNDSLLAVSDIDGRTVLYHFLSRSVIGNVNLHAPAFFLRFSPDSKYLATSSGAKVFIWKTPNTAEFQLAPLILMKTLRGIQGLVTSVEWDPTSSFVLVGSEDATVRLFSIRNISIPLMYSRIGITTKAPTGEKGNEEDEEEDSSASDEEEEEEEEMSSEELGDQLAEEDNDEDESIEGSESDDDDGFNSNKKKMKMEKEKQKNEELPEYLSLDEKPSEAQNEGFDRKNNSKRKKKRLTFRPVSFSGHRTRIMGAFFNSDASEMYSLSRDGTICFWKRNPPPKSMMPDYAKQKKLEREEKGKGKNGKEHGKTKMEEDDIREVEDNKSGEGKKSRSKSSSSSSPSSSSSSSSTNSTSDASAVLLPGEESHLLLTSAQKDALNAKHEWETAFARSRWSFIRKEYLSLGHAKVSSVAYFAVPSPSLLFSAAAVSADFLAAQKQHISSLSSLSASMSNILIVGLSSGVIRIMHPAKETAALAASSSSSSSSSDPNSFSLADFYASTSSSSASSVSASADPPAPCIATTQSLTLSNTRVTSVAFSANENWIAVGCAKEGLLSVWDWVNETVVMRQVGHGGVMVAGGKTFGVVSNNSSSSSGGNSGTAAGGDDASSNATSLSRADGSEIATGILTASFDGVSCCAFSPDSTLIATGASDGKVKIWSRESGFCIATFAEHSAEITGLNFLPRHALAASSKDGSVRLFDLKRFRTFRVLVPPSVKSLGAGATAGVAVSSCSLSSVCADSSGTLIAAGCIDMSGGSTFSSTSSEMAGTSSTVAGDGVAVWSSQTGQLLDFLSGHSGPVSCVAFSEEGTLLASGSWDGTVRLWDIFEKKGTGSEPKVLDHASEVLNVQFCPDSKTVATLTRRGMLSMWDVEFGKQLFATDISFDCVGSGGMRKEKQDLTANGFTDIHFSPDGSCIMCVGLHPFACLYDVSSKNGAVLLHRYRLAPDRLFPGITAQGEKMWRTTGMKYNKNWMDIPDNQEYQGEVDIDLADSDDEAEERGNAMGDDGAEGDPRPSWMASSAKQFGSRCVAFAPTGTAFVVATGRGAVVFDSNAAALAFDPFEFDEDVTEDAIAAALEKEEWAKALRTALRLGEFEIVVRVVESIPPTEIHQVVSSLPSSSFSRGNLVSRLLSFFGRYGDSSPHLQLCLLWVVTLLSVHSVYITKNRIQLLPSLRAIQKWMKTDYTSLNTTSQENVSLMKYLSVAHLESKENL
ncbi:putative WD repeat protein [Monocercomonoides exilis]|uniref:putative WD repeat protein n=1 Tax=Monocercomonoides exilis TaxID=2049356 RepID=UPI003559765F|nr:putative WD repeat protein [Monocercomonoides exilis]|eukprot:MONOS_14684.1-p1 / transcript=MONOS_14684.1 / gene=MONOS_14684 / organism=Monocercomonoides_exilis_PA203 / gene_product=Periodic tryptophan protein 2 / transcript_product=Periodic tryptophan protein 2 / location=Mono_scaffold01050:13529-17839(-) / protein_length=1274 / sequence_SO=supercontig / SO=protein_coding / is_pseudo=false